MILLVLIFIFIVFGIVNAGYLYWQHLKRVKENRPMVCPLNGHCEEVVESKYGKSFGVKNEILGILYLAILIILLLINLFYEPLTELARLAIVAIAFFGFLFSTYLLFLQTFVLKKYCTWCMFAAIDNYIIIVLMYFYLF